MNVTFGVIGLAFLAGAVLGKSVEFGGFKLPATGERMVRVGLAVLGVVALVIGLIPPQSSGANQQQAAGSSPLRSSGGGAGPADSTSATGATGATGAASDQAGDTAAGTESATASEPGGTGSTVALSAARVGTQLAVYDTILPDQHAVTLGSSSQAGAQNAQIGIMGDLYLSSHLLFPTFAGGVTVLDLPTAGPPTYHLCSFNGVRDDGVTIASGLSFCLQKSGLMFGITITSITQSPPQVSLHVVAWQGS